MQARRNTVVDPSPSPSVAEEAFPLLRKRKTAEEEEDTVIEVLAADLEETTQVPSPPRPPVTASRVRLKATAAPDADTSAYREGQLTNLLDERTNAGRGSGRR